MLTGRIGKYTIHQTIGSGYSCKVKLGIHTDTKQKVAVKILKQVDTEIQQLVMTEITQMAKLTKHQNIIKIIGYGQDVYEKVSGKSREVVFIILELAQGGSLFDFVVQTGKFSEAMARSYMRQILLGVDFCHQNGIAHRDLKPENMLLDLQNTLKISDFGFAGPITGRNGSGYLHTILGTCRYMAPEIISQQPYQGNQVDLFSCGVILFCMVTGCLPFLEAKKGDERYQYIAGNMAQVFWEHHDSQKNISDGLRDLIQALLQYDPVARPSITEVMGHEWINGEIPTENQITQEFAQRLQQLQMKEDEKLQKKKELKEGQLQKQIHQMKNGKKKTYRSGKDEEPYIFSQNLVIQQYLEGPVRNRQRWLSSYSGEIILEAIYKYAQIHLDQEPKQSSKKYKLQFHMNDVEMEIEILKVDEIINCVEFRPKSGDYIQFLNNFQELEKSELVYLYNL